MKLHRVLPAAALTALLAGCASTDPRDYLERCGATAAVEEGRRVVRYDGEQAACANQLAAQAQAQNERNAAAVAAGLALMAAGAAAGAAAATPPPAYYAPPARPRTCITSGSSFGGPGFRSFNGTTNCF